MSGSPARADGAWTTPPPITHVSGGVAGLSATYARVRALASRYHEAGGRMRGWAARAARVAAHPDLVESAPVSPVTFARAEAAVLDAGAGVHGLLELSLAVEGDAVALRVAVGALEECDRLAAAAMHAVDYEVGRALGTALVLTGPGAVAAIAGMVPATRSLLAELPDSARRRLTARLEATGDLAQEGLGRHPSLLQDAVDTGGGLLDGLLTGPALLGVTPYHPRLSDAARDVARLYADEGPARVRPRPDLSVGLGGAAPRSVADLMRHLEEANNLSPPDRPGDQGTIVIQTLRDADGSPRHVVYLPGTDALPSTPSGQDADVRDLATSLHLVAGEETTYGAGIEQAMHRAGIRAGDPVLLVGHSQGGMEAAALLAHGSPYHVTDVVTAGSPIAQVTGYPAGTHVLSLENRGDVVPLLDGAENPDVREHVTVQFDDHETSLAANHGLSHYVHGAEAVDTSLDRSIREQVASLQHQGFLGGRATASQVFQVTR